MKPGAKFVDVTSGLENIKDVGTKDCVVILAGTNDVASNEAKEFLVVLRSKLQSLQSSKTIVFSVPHRYDLPSWSCVNKEISRTNVEINKVCNDFKNVVFVDISNIGKKFHTGHGLHLNRLGKMYIVNKILELVGINTDEEIYDVKITSVSRRPNKNFLDVDLVQVQNK